MPDSDEGGEMRPFAQFHSVIPTEELRVMPPLPSMLDATEDSRDREERLHTVHVAPSG